MALFAEPAPWEWQTAAVRQTAGAVTRDWPPCADILPNGPDAEHYGRVHEATPLPLSGECAERFFSSSLHRYCCHLSFCAIRSAHSFLYFFRLMHICVCGSSEHVMICLCIGCVFFFCAQRLDGSTPGDVRKQAMDHFNADGSLVG